MKEIDKAREAIKNAQYIVFFGGAGTSTESGIPDFRGDKGLYKKTFMGYNPEEILHIDFVLKHPKIFYSFLQEKLSFDVEPNDGHRALAELEKLGKLKAIITQNIDGLHQKAGSKEVVELHGSLREYYCMGCGREDDKFFICDCGGIVRPNIILYGEVLDPDKISRAVYHIKKADVLIVAGTSLTVYPANSLLDYFNGDEVIFINTSPTPYDSMATIIIRKPFSIAMKEIMSF